MSWINNTLIFSSVIALMIFIISYIHSHKIISFFSKNILNTQKDILELMDKLFISQDKQKFKKQSWILSGSLSLLIFIVLWPNILVSLVCASLVFLGIWQALKWVFKKLWEKHVQQVLNQLVDALTVMCNSLKVGLSLGQAMDRVIKNQKGALSKEFILVLNKMKLGQTLEESLEDMAERIQKEDINTLVQVISVLKETGGNLAETFYIMANTLRERQKMQKKIQSLIAQGMMQAKIMSFTPLAMLGIFYVLDREYISPLLFKPLGWLLLAIVFALILVGGFFMRKAVKINI